MKYALLLLVALFAISCQHKPKITSEEAISLILDEDEDDWYKEDSIVLQEYQFKDPAIARQISQFVLNSPEYKTRCSHYLRMHLFIENDTSLIIHPLLGYDISDSSVGYVEIENTVFIIEGYGYLLLKPTRTKCRFFRQQVMAIFDPPTWEFKIRHRNKLLLQKFIIY